MGAEAEVESAARAPWLARCPGCGYDLTRTDLDAQPCPECGWEGTPEAREHAWQRARYLRSSRFVVPPVAVALVAAGPLAAHLASDQTSLVGAGLIPMTLVPGGVGVLLAIPLMAVTRARRFARLIVGAMWIRTLAWLLVPWLVALTWRVCADLLNDWWLAMLVLGVFYGYAPLIVIVTWLWANRWRRLTRRFGLKVGWAECVAALAVLVSVWRLGRVYTLVSLF